MSRDPYSEEQFQQIEEGIRKAKAALVMVETAKRADIETGDSEARARETLNKLLKVKQVYFPGR